MVLLILTPSLPENSLSLNAIADTRMALKYVMVRGYTVLKNTIGINFEK